MFSFEKSNILNLKAFLKYLFLTISLLNFQSYLGQNFEKINELKSSVQEESNTQSKINKLLELSALLQKSNPEESLTYALECLTLSRSIHFNKGKINAYFIIGELEMARLNYRKAATSFKNALEISISYGDSKGIAKAQIKLGNLYIEQKEFDTAKNYFSQTLAIGKKTKSNTIQAMANLAFGDLNFEQEKYFLAKEYYIIAEEFISTTKDGILKVEIYLKSGLILEKIGEKSEALIKLKKALTVSEAIKNKKLQARTCYEIGVINQELNRPDEALLFLKTSLGLAIEVSDEESIKQGYKTIANTYEENKNYKEAYEYLKFYSAIKDTRQISELEAQLKLLEKNKEIELITKEKNLHKEQARVEKFYKRMGYIVALVILGLSIFLFMSLKQRDRINAQLTQATKEANQSRIDKEEFFAYTNHEIRTPLNAVVGMSKILSETKLDKRQKKYLGTIKSSAQNILFLVNDVLDLSKIEKGGLEFEKIDFSLHEIVNQIVDSLSFKKFEKDVNLKIEIPEELPKVLIGDPVRFNQILLNLADNALKFTKQGEVKIKLSIIDEVKSKVRVKFEVIDTGIGIQEEMLDSIFDSYKQEHVSTTRQYGGTGLGLSISRLLVDAMGGQLKVQSRLNKGSNFYFDVWITKSTLIFNDSEQSIDTVTANTLQNVNILIVDDNQLNREIFIDFLASPENNVNVFTAHNGQDALEQIQEKNFDFILMDIQMPIMNGYEATIEIRKLATEQKKRTPIIAMTAHVLKGVAQKCIDSGMDSSLSKPVNIRILMTTIKELLPEEKFKQKQSEKETKNIETINKSVINLSGLFEMANNKHEKVLKYVTMILKNLPSDFSELKEHLATENWEDLKKKAHKIKGSLGYVGAERIKDEILYLEGIDLNQINKKEINKQTSIVDQEIILILKQLENFK